MTDPEPDRPVLPSAAERRLGELLSRDVPHAEIAVRLGLPLVEAKRRIAALGGLASEERSAEEPDGGTGRRQPERIASPYLPDPRHVLRRSRPGRGLDASRGARSWASQPAPPSRSRGAGFSRRDLPAGRAGAVRGQACGRCPHRSHPGPRRSRWRTRPRASSSGFRSLRGGRSTPPTGSFSCAGTVPENARSGAGSGRRPSPRHHAIRPALGGAS